MGTPTSKRGQMLDCHVLRGSARICAWRQLNSSVQPWCRRSFLQALAHLQGEIYETFVLVHVPGYGRASQDSDYRRTGEQSLGVRMGSASCGNLLFMSLFSV